MKKIIYILLTGLALFYGVDSVDAKMCYYDEGTTYKFKFNTNSGKVVITDRNLDKVSGGTEKVKNIDGNESVENQVINAFSGDNCPEYMMLLKAANTLDFVSFGYGFHVYVSDDKNQLQSAGEAFKNKRSSRYYWIGSKVEKDKYDLTEKEESEQKKENPYDTDEYCSYYCGDSTEDNLSVFWNHEDEKVAGFYKNTAITRTFDVKNIVDNRCPTGLHLLPNGPSVYLSNEDVPPSRGTSLYCRLNADSVYNNPNKVVEDPTVEVNTCKDLIGDRMIEELNNIMFYIRIAVPIILLVFGAFDFGTAVLSSDDGGMKKAQGKFIKRLIIGIAIFFIPTIVNLIIHIMNTVWGLGSDCGIK